MSNTLWPQVCRALGRAPFVEEVFATRLSGRIGARPAHVTTTLNTPEGRSRARLGLATRIAARFAGVRDLADLFWALHEETEPVIAASVFLYALYGATSEMVQVVRQVDRGVEHEGG